MGKGEIACNEQFLLFPQCFLPILRTFCHFCQIWNCRLTTLSVWKGLKFVVLERVKAFLMFSWFYGCVITSTALFLLAHLSTKCSEWAIVITRGLSSKCSEWAIVITGGLLSSRPSIHFFFCLHCSNDKYKWSSSKLGQNVYDDGILYEVDYGFNEIRLIEIICPWIRVVAMFDFVYINSIIYIYRLGQNVCDHSITISDDFEARTTGVFCSWIRGVAIFDLPYTLKITNVN